LPYFFSRSLFIAASCGVIRSFGLFVTLGKGFLTPFDGVRETVGILGAGFFIFGITVSYFFLVVLGIGVIRPFGFAVLVGSGTGLAVERLTAGLGDADFFVVAFGVGLAVFLID